MTVRLKNGAFIGFSQGRFQPGKNIEYLFTYQCCLLITFAISLDPDQARQNVGPDLAPNCWQL